ncbi:hypothetical protein FIBSPDRAFT_1038332 [Athelia psychrophila]|uniref:Uncharacterized protein n=1 Tax=Athelia psychrophila TaxID=1759441 RepID=A0A166T8B3_9AGAM|nr:hypothetical protein FIBSPDRAFT_1038332 [Fibularhizoctonia sp. CBS 109695]
MDLPSKNNAPRQQQPRSASASNDHASPSQSTTPPQPQQQQQAYPYPVQQQPQGGWTPSIAAQPFYPSFYPNQQSQQPSPQGYNMQSHSPSGQMAPGNPYFDPANAQLAQWAYQQMMYNAQLQQQGHAPQQSQRGSPNGTPDYFGQGQIPAFNSFPSGTPPPPNFGPGQQRNGSTDQQQHGGFHPYRRPNRQGSTPPQGPEWQAPPGAFQPPYGRADAAGSSTSVNSQNGYGAPRPRTNSNNTSASSANGSTTSARARGPGAPQSDHSRSRNGSTASAGSSSPQPQRPSGPLVHGRQSSSSSTASKSTAVSTSSAPRPSVSTTTSSVSSVSSGPTSPGGSTTTKARPVRPSPLSQGNFTATEKRMSRDDSDLAAMMASSSNPSMARGGGLKGRLRRALSVNAAQTLSEEQSAPPPPEDQPTDDDESIKASSSGRMTHSAKPSSSNSKLPVSQPVSGSVTDDGESTATVQTKKKTRSLFNARFNASTDNISLSSTVSSASVMIRKLGSMGNLARRNSLAGITSLFKDKKNKDGEDSKKDKKKKDKKGGKGDAAEASVSHATAELDRGSSDWQVGSHDMPGLSPAAKLARQHTLKSNAEAAERVKAQQEAAAAAATAAATNANGTHLPDTWDKNTTTRSAQSPARAGGARRVNEDGTRVLVEEDDDSASETGSEGTYDARRPQVPGQVHTIAEGWDEDEDWADGQDQDVTIRVNLENTRLGEPEVAESEEWGGGVRRSVERARQPKKGILKYAGTYDQQSYSNDNTNSTGNRARANSDNSHPTQNSELGPLARIPSPDPDHIDGLSRHPSHSSQHGNSPKVTPHFLPKLDFESSEGLSTESPQGMDSGRSSPINPTEKPAAVFSHPSFNSSAPTLSMLGHPMPPALTHRSATSPAKRLIFANNLSVYDTFSANMYDRRSEPATWSRLTPALAQRIKEELNSYKMEEMEVHAASRIHTQFFV